MTEVELLAKISSQLELIVFLLAAFFIVMVFKIFSGFLSSLIG